MRLNQKESESSYQSKSKRVSVDKSHIFNTEESESIRGRNKTY